MPQQDNFLKNIGSQAMKKLDLGFADLVDVSPLSGERIKMHNFLHQKNLKIPDIKDIKFRFSQGNKSDVVSPS